MTGRPTERVLHPRARADEPIRAVARRVLALNLRRLQTSEGAVRAGRDPEAVHDMRVAVRRLRVGLLVLGEHLGRDRSRQLAKTLRSVGRTLGGLRDLDVLIEHVARAPAGKPVATILRDRLRMARSQERARVLAMLRSPGYADLKRGLREISAARSTAPSHERPSPTVRAAAPGLVCNRLLRVWLRAREVSEQPTARRLHRLRIAAKRLRYTLEFFQGALGAEAEQAIVDLRRAQDLLGRAQDAVTAVDAVRKILRRASRGSQPPLPWDVAYLRQRERERRRLLAGAPRTVVVHLGAPLGRRVTACLAPLEPRGGRRRLRGTAWDRGLPVGGSSGRRRVSGGVR